MNIPAGPSDKIIIPSNFEINALKFQFHCFTLLSLYSYISLSIISMVWPYLGVKIGGLGGCAITRVPSRQVANSAGDEGWSLVVGGIKIKAISQQKYKQGTDTERPMASFPLFHQKDCHHLFGTLFTIWIVYESVATDVVPNDGFCAIGDSE